jgi:predicted nucleotidyltransferase component of viral defense system
MMINVQSTIEIFHLLFLQQLEKQMDKKLYALKGGCNLRFFFKSIRYSEDIDFDVTTISKTTLEKKVSKILSSVNFSRILQSNGVEIIQSNPVKQTDTTQRWKLLLRIKQSTLPIPTKIEFSRRKMEEGVAYTGVDTELLTQYRLYPIICNHYTHNTAVIQKMRALIGRTETQARDIFDLKWLLDQDDFNNISIFSETEINTVIQNSNGITYEDYKGQVVAYLMEPYQAFYGTREKWDEIRSQVIKTLMAEHYAPH